MAAKLGVAIPPAGGTPTANWIRLGRPISAFDLIADVLAAGGLGWIEALRTGPGEDSVLLLDPT